jgi:hypothetical protein
VCGRHLDRGGWGANTWARPLCQVLKLPNRSNESKKDFSGLRKFKIKYGCEGFEERNNFFIGTSLDSKWISNEKLEKL